MSLFRKNRFNIFFQTIIFPNINLKTINFIREKFNNLENHLGDNISFKGINNKQASNKANSTMQVLFILTLISILIIPYLIKLFSEDYGENFIGLVKNFYLFLYLLPIPILSFVLGMFLIFITFVANCSAINLIVLFA